MSVLITVLGSIASYLAIGWLLAKRDMPRVWARARDEWSIESSARESVVMCTALTLFFWPVRLPLVRMWGALEKSADRNDPKAVEAELRTRLEVRERRIAELEHELGIERSAS